MGMPGCACIPPDGDDGKHRCEKCAWCIEDAGYDGEFLDYLK